MSNSNANMPFIVAISLVATLGGFLFGFDSGVINGTVEGLQTAFNSNSMGTGFNVASMLLGCAVGAFFAGYLADIYGRRSLLLVAAVLFLISAWGSGIATSSIEFILYRILGGLAVGAASVMAPAYISEIAPTEIRGRLSSIQQVAIICGLSAAFFSNYLLANFAGGSTAIFLAGYEAWRWMFWIELIPASLFLITLILIPESPRYLALKNQDEAALAVLTKLQGGEAAKTLLADIHRSLETEPNKPNRSDLKDDSGKVRTIVWVGIGLASFQQLVGINVVFYYGAVLWQSVGFSEADALQINILSGLLSIAAVILALCLIDKIGRKPLLLIGSIGMAVTLAIVAIAFAGADTVDGQLVLSDISGKVALVSANAYVMFFNFSWGPVMWVMLAEMFPNKIRGSGLAIAGLFQWLSNFLITMSFPIMLSVIGLAAAYGLYALFAGLSVLFVVKMVRETQGVSLEEMRG